MDRKLECRTKISGLILVGVLLPAVWFSATAKPPKKLLDEYARSIEQKTAALDSIKAELKRGREKLESLKKKEGSVLSQLTQLERNIDNSQQYINEIAAGIDTIGAQMSVLTDSLHVASEQLEYRQALMKKRLRIMYKVGRSYRSNDLMGMLQLAGSSRSVADLVHRVRYAREVNRYDRRLMATIESLRDDIEQRAIALEERREMLFALKMEKEQEQSTLLSQTTERRKMLDEVQAEKEAYESMVAELEQAQKQLNILITTLEKKRKDAKKEWERGRTIAFEKRKGELPWPVSGKVVRDFGKIVHPVYKTVTMSLGIDIAATNGDMVTCVAPGKVDYVGWMRGYGKFVIVNHFNDYLTIYAHLGEISVEQEQELEFGAIVGKVGETGSLSGPKLHFQIRKSTEALDPTGWLQKL